SLPTSDPHHWSPRSPQPAGEPSRPPALATDPFYSRPSGSRSPRSDPRRSLNPLGPGEIRADGPPTRQAIFDRVARSPASSAAAHERPRRYRAAKHSDELAPFQLT